VDRKRSTMGGCDRRSWRDETRASTKPSSRCARWRKIARRRCRSCSGHTKAEVETQATKKLRSNKARRNGEDCEEPQEPEGPRSALRPHEMSMEGLANASSPTTRAVSRFVYETHGLNRRVRCLQEQWRKKKTDRRRSNCLMRAAKSRTWCVTRFGSQLGVPASSAASDGQNHQVASSLGDDGCYSGSAV